VSGKPVVSKNQRAGRIKRSDIEVQIHTITSGKNYEQVGNFRDGCYELKSLGLDKRTTLVLSNTRELDRELFYKLVYLI